MRARFSAVLTAVALSVPAALAAPAGAQLPSPTATPTPTATPSPTPTPEERRRAERDERDRRAKPVRRIYRDFQRDGRIDDCDHTKATLKRARRSIEDSYEEDYPDFRDALTAAIERHDDGKCEEQQEQLEQDNSDGSPSPTATATPAPGIAPAPAPAPPPPPPPTSPDSGELPDFGAGGTGGSGGGLGGSDGGVTPLPGEDAIPEGTPSPTPAPAATPAPPPNLVVTRAAASPDMFVPGTLLAIALLGLLAAGGSALAARRSERFAGVGHAWREAAWRTSGTWSDFTDWLRAGR